MGLGSFLSTCKDGYLAFVRTAKAVAPALGRIARAAYSSVVFFPETTHNVETFDSDINLDTDYDLLGWFMATGAFIQALAELQSIECMRSLSEKAVSFRDNIWLPMVRGAEVASLASMSLRDIGGWLVAKTPEDRQVIAGYIEFSLRIGAGLGVGYAGFNFAKQMGKFAKQHKDANTPAQVLMTRIEPPRRLLRNPVYMSEFSAIFESVIFFGNAASWFKSDLGKAGNALAVAIALAISAGVEISSERYSEYLHSIGRSTARGFLVSRISLDLYYHYQDTRDIPTPYLVFSLLVGVVDGFVTAFHAAEKSGHLVEHMHKDQIEKQRYGSTASVTRFVAFSIDHDGEIAHRPASTLRVVVDDADDSKQERVRTIREQRSQSAAQLIKNFREREHSPISHSLPTPRADGSGEYHFARPGFSPSNLDTE